MNKNFRISLIQHSYTRGQKPEDNRQKLGEIIRKTVKRENPELVVLPELSSSLYFCQTESLDNFSDYSERLRGESFRFFSGLARELQILLNFSIFEESEDYCYYNTSLILEKDGSLAGFYRKVHLPQDPCFYEKFYFKAGNKLEPIKTSLGKIGLLICWDQWFPEAARTMALKGAQLLIYPTAIGSLSPQIESSTQREQQIDSWLTVQKSQAIVNGCFLVCVNRVGREEEDNSEINFWGKSFVCSPNGRISKIASSEKAEVLTEELDFQLVKEQRISWPFLRDLQNLESKIYF